VLGRAATRLLPKGLRRRRLLVRNRKQLASMPREELDVSRLGSVSGASLARLFHDPLALLGMEDAERILGEACAGEGGGGVNPGDRKALFALVRALRPRQVLEVGTHVGSSTVTLAAALRENGRRDPSAGPGRLVTVDLRDVNDPATRPWLESGSRRSPRELLVAGDDEDLVTFVMGDATAYLRECTSTFDLVFLDGDHSAAAVYREVTLAARRLAPGGCIVLHDCFPGLEPLWRDGEVIPGPWLAVERLQRECPGLCAVPLGKLPWPTKQGSSRTSLLVLGRAAALSR